jgi:hypothetical protein
MTSQDGTSIVSEMAEGSKKHLLKTGFDIVCTVACVKFLTVLTVHSILCIANNSLLDLEFWAWIWKKSPSSVPEKRGGQAPRKISPELPKEYSDIAMHEGTVDIFFFPSMSTCIAVKSLDVLLGLLHPQ